MKKLILVGGLLLVSQSAVFAQFGGGAMSRGAMGGGAISREGFLSPSQNELAKRRDDSPGLAATRDDPSAMFIEASVLMNVKADEYVAVFAVSHQEKTVVEANTKMNATIKGFKDALKRMSLRDSDVFVDFVLQNRVYTYTVEPDAGPERRARAKEELAGFELKKNVSVRFKNKELLDPMTSVASQLGIYDLVKVEYIVSDIPAVQAKLQAETARVLKAKIERYNQFGVQSLSAVQIITDKPSVYYPLVNYTSYQAAESNRISVDSDRYTIEGALKTNTYYFNPLDGNGFDVVVNPVILEPVVQFTSYVKVRAKRLS